MRDLPSGREPFAQADAPPDAYTVVVPAFDAAATLGDCLSALNAAQPAPAEIIVYDDGSADQTAAIARAAGARVIAGRTPKAGPAVGRNAGARAARTPVVIFVDADVVVDTAAPGLLARAVVGGAAAAFGAYAATSEVANAAGRYANLRHHHTHVTAPGDAETFWSGLGAVDRAAFLAVGGFDEGYARPCVEDVELGLRLREAGGTIRVVPEARGQHLKNWTLTQLWHTDVFSRAVPWTEMMADGRIPPTLNTGGAERAKSVLAHLVWVTALAGFLTPWAWLATIAFAAAYLYANRRFLSVLRRDSKRLTAAGAALHWLYHCYASVTCALVLARIGFATRMRGRRSAQPVRA